MFRAYLMLFAVVSAAALAADPKVSLLLSDPVSEAEDAFKRGDRRPIVVPICSVGQGEVLPGWPLQSSSAHLQAITSGLRPFTCSELPGEPEFLAAAKWAERYNHTMLKLANAPAR